MLLTDSELRDLLVNSRVIAVVGHSHKTFRDSYAVGRYLRQAGYRVYAINPNIPSVDGEPAYPRLADAPEGIDIVNVFRSPDALPQVVEDAIAVQARAIWTQLGVIHPQAEARARAAGLITVVNLCLMVEHQRLGIQRLVP